VFGVFIRRHASLKVGRQTTCSLEAIEMKRVLMVVMALASLFVPVRLFAQSMPADPGRVEVSLIPVGGTFFTAKTASPSFGNFTLGGAVTYNLTPWVAVEGEVTGTLGISQTLQFGTVNGKVKTPNMASYTGNVVISLATHSSVTPYAVGGIGGLTVLDTTALGIATSETFFTGDVGGGVRWYANRRWGVRGDYRFIAVQRKDVGAPFFGRDTRYGHRVYGAVVVNVLQ
jgi:opacity protein-like surface antigen